MNVQVGSAPDSWGVWFPSDPQQMPWTRFLDEIAAVGYKWIELGPYGYLPTDVEQLREELARRDLRTAGTFVQFDLGRDGAWEQAAEEVSFTCELLRQLGAPHLILIDEIYSDTHTGELIGDPEIDEQGWRRLVEATRRVRDTAGEHGLRVVFHPHADTHVQHAGQIERLLDDVPDLSLCLDVGHFAYSDGSDPVAFFRDHAARVHHLHLKSVDGELRDRVMRDGVPFCKAVAEGIFVEPARGVVDFKALRDALIEADYDGFAIAEQDMYPAPPDKPLPIAQRTFDYFRELELV